MSKYLKTTLIILGIFNLIVAIGIITNYLYEFEKIDALGSMITVAAVFGIWKYKRWGVYLYFLSVLIALITYICKSVDFINYITLIIHMLLIYPVKNIWQEFD